jgi:hypothetical protein
VQRTARGLDVIFQHLAAGADGVAFAHGKRPNPPGDTAMTVYSGFLPLRKKKLKLEKITMPTTRKLCILLFLLLLFLIYT